MNRGALAGPYLRRTKFLRRERSDHEHRRRHHLQHNDSWRQQCEGSRVVASRALAAVNCFAAVRGESLRIAPHLHITDTDCERLCDALTAAMQ